MSDEKTPVILSIDDEEIIRETIRDFLECFDYKVLEAENGREGLAILELENPDMVLVDLRMPEVDGLQVLAKMKADTPDTPVIIISGTGVIADAVEALRLGAWDYLLKPIEDLSVLRHAVEKNLDRARLMRENREYREQLEEKVRTRTAQLEDINKELRRTRMQVIQCLGKAAEYKDDETGRHVIRVSYYSGIMAEALGLAPELVDLIRLCSPMHDIGKIGIPDHILLKAGPLDTEEWHFMQQHCMMGADMLSPPSQDELMLYRKHTTIGHDILGNSDSEILQMARKIAARHHEHWDGSGYPVGLKGENIPIEARIVTVADIYDALSSERSYKKPFSEEKCQQIIRELTGTFLDPNIASVFFNEIDKILRIKEDWKD